MSTPPTPSPHIQEQQHFGEISGIAGTFAPPPNEGAPERWLAETEPTVADVLKAAGQDPDRARQLIEAERAHRGRDARTTLIAELAKVVRRGESHEPEEEDAP